MGEHEILPIELAADQDERDQLEHEVEQLRDQTANLQRALETSRKIGTAVGIVMSTEKVTRERAFDRLRIVSQHENRKLRDVADEVLETGTLPMEPTT